MNLNADTLRQMTPAQQKRLGQLMLRDVMDSDNSSLLNFTPNSVPSRPNTFEDVDTMLNSIQARQTHQAKSIEIAAIDRVEQLFNREELFRFAYVPFVIAELVWDYADTVILLAQGFNDPSQRRLSREIRRARAEYDKLRNECIMADSRKREQSNGYVFEDGINRITSQMILNIRLDINSEYPDASMATRDFLVAVYQCHIMSKSLLRFLDQQTEKAAKRIGSPVGRLLPKPYYVMDSLIPLYIGDMPASPRLRKMLSDYIRTFSTQMALIHLDDTPNE